MVGPEWTQDEETLQHFHDAVTAVGEPLNALFEHMFERDQFGETPPFLIFMLLGKFVGHYNRHFEAISPLQGESYDAQFQSYIHAISQMMEDPILHAVVQMGVNQGVN